MTLKNIAPALAAAVAAMACGPSLAGAPAAGDVAVSVSLGDLNLKSPAGAQVALRRIEQAAGAICGSRPALADLGRSRLFDTCLQTTVERAVTQLDAPMVTAVYHGSEKPILSAEK